MAGGNYRLARSTLRWLWTGVLLLAIAPALPAAERPIVLSATPFPKTEPDTSPNDFLQAIDLAQNISLSGQVVPFTWSQLEPAAGEYDLDEIINDMTILGARGFKLVVAIDPLEVGGSRVPADLAGKPFDSPEVIARYRALIDRLADTLDQYATFLLIGEEVDIPLGNDEDAPWGEYRTFYDHVVEYVHQVAPNVQVGVGVTFDGAFGRNAIRVQFLNERSDVFVATLYPRQEPDVPTYPPQDPVLPDEMTGPTAPHAAIPVLLKAAGERPLLLTEVGYPSDPLTTSSEADQALFYRSFFESLWGAHGQIAFANFYSGMHDLSKPRCDEIIDGLDLTGVSPEARQEFRDRFEAWLCSLGLRERDGTRKAAWDVVVTGSALTRVLSKVDLWSGAQPEAHAGDPGARGVIAGTVTDARTGDPIPGAVVLVRDADGVPGGIAVTGADGGYRVHGLPAGAYRAISFNLDGHVDELYGDVPCDDRLCEWSQGDTAVVAAGEVTTAVDFALARSAEVGVGAPPAAAGDTPSAPGAVKTTLDLAGEWQVVAPPGFESLIRVPGVFPFAAGITRWTRSFQLQLPGPPNVAFLDFGGISGNGVVRLNGTRIGELQTLAHRRFDVRSVLRPQGENVIEVEIDDRVNEFTVPGGLTAPEVEQHGAAGYLVPIAWEHGPGVPRSVRLVYSERPVVDQVMVDQTFAEDFARAALLATVKIRGEAADGTVAVIRLERGGELAGICMSGPSEEAAHACEMVVESPVLWSPRSPELYDLEVTLYDGDGIADAHRERIGLRKFEASGSRFRLNGEAVFLRGISRHGLYGRRNYVADEATIRQDLITLKRLGFNYVRAVHYPPDPRFALAADEIGMLISEEIPAWAHFQEPDVSRIAGDMIFDMINRDFNRPSVVMWYTGTSNGLNAHEEGHHELMMKVAKLADPHRPSGVVFDDDTFAAQWVADDLKVVRDTGMDFYAKNGYLEKDEASEAVDEMPRDMPVMLSEWGGSEGTDRQADPGLGPRNSPDGAFTEAFHALKIIDAFDAWADHAECPEDGSRLCLAGMVYFNWQDFRWPSLPLLYPDHEDDVLRSGLVYEDRGNKPLPMTVMHLLNTTLPGLR